MDDFFLWSRVADAFGEVVLEGRDKGGVGYSVAEDSVGDPLLKRGDDFGWAFEVHVGHPEGIEVWAAVPLEGAGFTAVRNGFKHRRLMQVVGGGRKKKLALRGKK